MYREDERLGRRHFLAASGILAVETLGQPFLSRAPSSTESSQTEVKTMSNEEHPILGTLGPVLSQADHVRLHPNRIEWVADWLAYEGIAWPDFFSPLHPSDDNDTIDLMFLMGAINFAFTDFVDAVMFRVEYEGQEYSDSEAMVACLKRAFDADPSILEGEYLAQVTRADLETIFRGNNEMPMLDERVVVFKEVGQVLQERYGGRFHRFLDGGPPRLYAQGQGLLERLLAEFPSFRDTSSYGGDTVAFQKRAQLLFWTLHSRFRATGRFRVEDMEKSTAFADYIVPVALRLFGILSYSDALETRIRQHQLLEAGSEEEVEIRAFTLWACHLLTEAVNERRPAELQIITPLLDARLWTHFHTTHWPHHLTVTTAY